MWPLSCTQWASCSLLSRSVSSTGRMRARDRLVVTKLDRRLGAVVSGGVPGAIEPPPSWARPRVAAPQVPTESAGRIRQGCAGGAAVSGMRGGGGGLLCGAGDVRVAVTVAAGPAAGRVRAAPAGLTSL